MLKKNMITHRIGSILFFIGLLLLWELAAWAGASLGWWKSYAFPEPVGVLKSLIDLASTGMLVRAVAASMWRVLKGFLLGLCVGGVLGFILIMSPFLKKNLKPLLIGIQSLPSICWVPFAILWFGLKESSVIFVVVMGCMFSVAITIEDAIQNIPVIYVKAAKTMGAPQKMIFTKVLLPAALPAIVAGLKQAWSFAWRALMSGEVMTSYVGLGYTLMIGRDMADINQVMAVMLVIVLLGTLIDKFIFTNLEHRLLLKRGLGLKEGD